MRWDMMDEGDFVLRRGRCVWRERRNDTMEAGGGGTGLGWMLQVP